MREGRLRVTRPVPDVVRLSSVYTNWYLIEQGGRLTVVDGGLPRDWPGFCSAFHELGYDEADVEAVLITHHHLDHAGNAERLRSTGARVLSHPADAPYLTGESHIPLRAHARFLLNPWYARYIIRLLAKGITRVSTIAELDAMSDGQVLDVPGRPRVIHVPGHTAGSCALFIERRSLLFSGDALVTFDVTRGRRVGPQIIRGPVTEDADLAMESLDALAGTEAEIVLPGHGTPWNHGIETAVSIARTSSDPGA